MRFILVAAALMALLWPGVDSMAVRCPNGFTGSDGSCYKFVKMAATWMEAKVLCEMMGAHLVEVDSPIEEQFIIQRIFVTDPGLLGRPLWLGATDLMNDHEWVWMHTKKRVGYHNWSMGTSSEDDNVDKGRCLAMQTEGRITWTRKGCDQAINFICEHEEY